jgi:hypothetical protein
MALNVKLIRLITGEELIAEVIHQDEKQVVIKNPIRVVLMPNQSRDPKAAPTIGFAPWVEFSEDKKIELDKSHVLYIVTPVQEFINQYNSIHGGIVAPSSKLILPS